MGYGPTGLPRLPATVDISRIIERGKDPEYQFSLTPADVKTISTEPFWVVGSVEKFGQLLDRHAGLVASRFIGSHQIT